MDDTEAGLEALLAKLKRNCEAENGPGSFEHLVRRGRLMMAKHEKDLTDEERAFLRSPPPAKQH